MMRRLRHEVELLLFSPASAIALLGVIFLDFRLFTSRQDPSPFPTGRTSFSALSWNFASLIGFAVVAAGTAWTFSIGSSEQQLQRDILNHRGTRPMFMLKALSMYIFAVAVSLLLWLNLLAMTALLPEPTMPFRADPVAIQVASWLISVTLVLTLTIAIVVNVREWATSTLIATTLLMVPSLLGGDSWTRYTPTALLARIARLPVPGEHRMFFGTVPGAGRTSTVVDVLVIWAYVVAVSSVAVWSIRRQLRVSGSSLLTR